MTDNHHDPAVDAARRAWDAAEEPFIPMMSLEQAAIAAAREALAPIRALHRAGWTGKPRELLCSECMTAWPCDTARLVYTAEELREEQ